MASILVLGEPGTGKSRAIKNLDPKTTFIIKPNNKQLPFKGAANIYGTKHGNTHITSDFNVAGQLIKQINIDQKQIKTVIVEDLTHFFSARVMKDASISGFNKWMDLANDVFKAFVAVEAELREDLNLIIIAHTQSSMDTEGNYIVTLQTPGEHLPVLI